MKKHSLVFIILFSAVSAMGTTRFAQHINFDGVLVDPATGAPINPSPDVKIQIVDPTGSCILFESLYTGLTLDADGSFSIKVGPDDTLGVRNTSIDGNLAWEKIFQSVGEIRAAGSTGCSAGYNPSVGSGNHDRKIRVTVNGTALSPLFSMSPAAMASVAQTLQGKELSEFISADNSGNFSVKSGKELQFYNTSNGNFVALRAPSTLSSSKVYELPVADGSSGHVLTTNGSGVLSWTAPTASVAVGAGSISNPSMSFSADADTGLYNPASNEIGFVTGGVPKMTLKSDGKVGIGTTIPANALDVIGAISSTMGLTTGGAVTTSSNVTGLFLEASGNTTQAGFARLKEMSVNGNNHVDIRAPTALAANLTLTLPDHTGSNGDFLKTNGAGELSWGSPSAVQATLLSDSDSNTKVEVEKVANEDKIRFSTMGLQRMIVDNAGNVGIGTLSPINKLTVWDQSSVLSGSYLLKGTNLTVSPASNSGATFTGDYISVANTVGNTVTRTVGSNIAVANSGTGTTTSASGIFSEVTNSSAGIINLADAVSGVVRNTSAGNIAIARAFYATVTNAAGSVNQAYGLYIDAIQGSTQRWSIYAADSTAPSYFNGNVGIGTTSPSEKLEVTGNVNVLGSVKISSMLKLARNGTQPAVCNMSNDGSVALTGPGGMCVCDGSNWLKVKDGTTCIWSSF